MRILRRILYTGIAAVFFLAGSVSAEMPQLDEKTNSMKIPEIGDYSAEIENGIKEDSKVDIAEGTVGNAAGENAKETEKAEEVEETESAASEDGAVYTDEEAQISFIIPENWAEAPLTQQTQVIKTKLAPTTDDELYYIMYGAVDIWGNLSESDRSLLESAGYDRSNVDDLYSDSDLAKMIAGALEITEDELTKTVYGETEYYTATIATDMEKSGTSISFEMTSAVVVKNGYMYLFEFYGSKDSIYFEDFEELLSSVEYGL